MLSSWLTYETSGWQGCCQKTAKPCTGICETIAVVLNQDAQLSFAWLTAATYESQVCCEKAVTCTGRWYIWSRWLCLWGKSLAAAFASGFSAWLWNQKHTVACRNGLGILKHRQHLQWSYSAIHALAVSWKDKHWQSIVAQILCNSRLFPGCLFSVQHEFVQMLRSFYTTDSISHGPHKWSHCHGCWLTGQQQPGNINLVPLPDLHQSTIYSSHLEIHRSRSSARWRHMLTFVLVVAFLPAPSHFLWRGRIMTSGSAGPLLSLSKTLLDLSTAVCRPHTGSMTCMHYTWYCMHCTAVMHYTYVVCDVQIMKTEQMHCNVRAADLKTPFVKKRASKGMSLHWVSVTHRHVCNFVEQTNVSAHVVCIMCQKTAADGYCWTSSRWTKTFVDGSTLRLIMQVYVIRWNRAVPSCSWSRFCPILALSHFWKLLGTGWTPLELTLACHAAWRPIDNANMELVCQCETKQQNTLLWGCQATSSFVLSLGLWGESEMARQSTCFQQ